MHLITSPRQTADMARLGAAARRRGWTVWAASSWRPPEGVAARLEGGEEGLVVYGEPLFARLMVAQLGWVLVEPTLDWLAEVPGRFLGREVGAGALGEVLGMAGPLFVKPADSKTFRAAVYEVPGVLGEREGLEVGEPVLWSAPVRWADEWRVFVEEGRARAASLYARDGVFVEEAGEASARAQAAAFVEEVLRAVEAPPAVVVDVGRLDDGRWAVVEANPCFGSGLYQCDADGALDVLRRACLPLASAHTLPARWMQPVTLDP